MKRTPYLTQRQEDGSYLVLASDGAWLHRLGTIRGEWVQGPKRGRRRRWHLQPESAQGVDTEPAHTLGEARGRLVRAWESRQQPSPAAGRLVTVCFQLGSVDARALAHLERGRIPIIRLDPSQPHESLSQEALTALLPLLRSTA